MLFLFNFVCAAAVTSATTTAPGGACGPELGARPRIAPVDDPYSGRWQRYGRRLRTYWDRRTDDAGHRRVLVYWDAEPRFAAVHAFLTAVAGPGAGPRGTLSTPQGTIDVDARTIRAPAWQTVARAWRRDWTRAILATYEVPALLTLKMRPSGVEDALGVEVTLDTLFDDAFGRALARLVHQTTTPAVSLDEAGTHVFALKDGLARDMADYAAARGLTP